jgi:hypothetical protein
MPAVTVNATASEISRAREELAGVFGSLDAGRPNAWGQYGYKAALTFQDLMQAYDRGGAGHGAVHRILDKCWQQTPRIKQPKADAATPWEDALTKQLQAVRAWQKLRDFDRRNMVGRYAGLIYRVADGLALREPVTRGKLVDIVPVYENQIKVTAWNNDTASPDYGQPTMWQYQMRPRHQVGDMQGAPDQWVDVHPSRIQIMAEGSVGDFLDGVPLLRAGFNCLVDIEKIAGGSAESFLKNSARTLVMKFDANATPQVIATNPDGSASGESVAEVMEAKTRALNRNQDSSIVMQGGDASTLQTTVSDPAPSFQVAANLFAASVQIPFTVLFGQQTGRMASDEDKVDMLARCQARQVNELTPMLRELVTRLQAIGAVEAGEFEIEWPALDMPGDTEKADVLGKMTAAMKQAFDAGLSEPLFDANELRRVIGFEKRADDGMPGEGADPINPAA